MIDIWVPSIMQLQKFGALDQKIGAKTCTIWGDTQLPTDGEYLWYDESRSPKSARCVIENANGDGKKLI